MFLDYLKLGFDHILDINGYDHILFVAVLCALYAVDEWKKILLLVTAFTLGHSLTLALSSLDIVHIKADFVEMVIPITIILTGMFNIFKVLQKSNAASFSLTNYGLALGFGLIHGLGFSYYFKAILGKEESILMPLFAFNLGVELGQILIVSAIMMISYLWVDLLKFRKSIFTIVISSIAITVSFFLLLDR